MPRTFEGRARQDGSKVYVGGFHARGELIERECPYVGTLGCCGFENWQQWVTESHDRACAVATLRVPYSALVVPG